MVLRLADVALKNDLAIVVGLSVQLHRCTVSECDRSCVPNQNFAAHVHSQLAQVASATPMTWQALSWHWRIQRLRILANLVSPRIRRTRRDSRWVHPRRWR